MGGVPRFGNVALSPEDNLPERRAVMSRRFGGSLLRFELMVESALRL
jgi:hypothetical protein